MRVTLDHDAFCPVQHRTRGDQQTRRDLLTRLGAITSLITVGRATSALAGSAGHEVSRWIRRIDEITAALRGDIVSVGEWRDGLGQLLSRVALSDVMHDIDFHRLEDAAGFAELGVTMVNLDLGTGGARRLSFHPKLFAVDRGRAIIPHGHANMVSAHLTLSGRFHLRQYDQIARDHEALVIRPTIDRRVIPGDLSSIGEDSDNVHWFIAEEPSHTFDVIVTSLDPTAERRYDIFNLDMERAVPLEDGRLRVPRIGVSEALAKYG